MEIKYKGRKIDVPNVKRCNFFERFRGLMFCRRRNSRALLFECGDSRKIVIHSFFVFFDFFAIWLDEKNNVLEIKRVKPFTPVVFPKTEGRLLEVPINKKYMNICNRFRFK